MNQADDAISDALSMVFTSEPGTKGPNSELMIRPGGPSRKAQISQDILQLAQELVDLHTRDEEFQDVQSELIQP